MLGIAVTTFNRAALIAPLVDSIRKFTSEPYDLVFCDDGSTDDTLKILMEHEVAFVTGKNRGVAWNKNRGLFYLQALKGVENVVLLDDDVQPTKYGWNEELVNALDRYGHVNMKNPPQPLLSGKCTADDIGVSNYVGGVCMAFSRHVLSFLGFMDTRFQKYGYEHIDLTRRAVRLGYGGYNHGEGEMLKEYFYVIECGLSFLSVDSNANQDSIAYNAHVLHNSWNEPIFRPAWRSEEEYNVLRDELSAHFRHKWE